MDAWFDGWAYDTEVFEYDTEVDVRNTSGSSWNFWYVKREENPVGHIGWKKGWTGSIGPGATKRLHWDSHDMYPGTYHLSIYIYKDDTEREFLTGRTISRTFP